MIGFQLIFLVAGIITDVSAQWRSRTVNGNNNNNNPRRVDVHAYAFAPSQQPPSQQTTTNRWNQSGQRPQQRQQNLVDYPFTVEYVDRRNPASRKGMGSLSKSQKHDDENLIDYPFIVEYIGNMNNPAENVENRGQASLPSNQDRFQLKTQQHRRYQRNNQHHHIHHSSGGHYHKSGGSGSGW